ncbi:MAG: hypothetical protein AUH78_17540 [Gemmatimonadetes bacterium 13_1_40CM_4_69_8]|nr:MAG: hypothetical protein AUH45_10350 [Gemmatimonadetes bacterium 13_1_40CM_69_22]OLC71775.1 MAG: hypothetical protein AUH78_17540 [Gemmatimonadetes bacterium 13_1_40CM_4_69_8]
MRSQLLLLAAALALAVGCKSSTSPSGGGRSTTITVGNNFFSPTPDTVAAGQVTFSWSTPSNGHNVTWLTGPTTPPNSATMQSGTFPATLQAGTYTYHCTIHAGMNGTIVVQ